MLLLSDSGGKRRPTEKKNSGSHNARRKKRDTRGKSKKEYGGGGLVYNLPFVYTGTKKKKRGSSLGSMAAKKRSPRTNREQKQTLVD